MRHHMPCALHQRVAESHCLLCRVLEYASTLAATTHRCPACLRRAQVHGRQRLGPRRVHADAGLALLALQLYEGQPHGSCVKAMAPGNTRAGGTRAHARADPNAASALDAHALHCTPQAHAPRAPLKRSHTSLGASGSQCRRPEGRLAPGAAPSGPPAPSRAAGARWVVAQCEQPWGPHGRVCPAPALSLPLRATPALPCCCSP